jgi:hypothetical protein
MLPSKETGKLFLLAPEVFPFAAALSAFTERTSLFCSAGYAFTVTPRASAACGLRFVAKLSGSIPLMSSAATKRTRDAIKLHVLAAKLYRDKAKGCGCAANLSRSAPSGSRFF